MPAAKRGTVTEEVTTAIREANGMLDWKGDKLGYVRAAVGRVSASHISPMNLSETNCHNFEDSFPYRGCRKQRADLFTNRA